MIKYLIENEKEINENYIRIIIVWHQHIFTCKSGNDNFFKF